MKKNTTPTQKSNPWYYRGIIGRLTSRNRKNRENKIIHLLDINSSTKILDVGCGPKSRSINNIMSIAKEVVGVDLFDPKYLQTKNENFKYYQLDASDMSIFKKNQFDVGLSFGMMEHIPGPIRSNILMEMYRTCKTVAIIVPHKFAYIEPHFKLPLFSIYPLLLKTILVKIFDLHGNKKRSFIATKERLSNEYFWLSKKKWKSYQGNSKTFNIYYGPILVNLLVIYHTK